MATLSKQKVFSVGHLVYVPSTTNATPVPVATLQEVSLTIKGTTKKLMGANRVAEDIALAEMEISGKYKSGTVRSGLIAAALPGATVTTGSMVRGVFGESTGAISGTSYTALHPTGYVDLGVWDDSGKLMTRGATATAAGVYAVTSGGVFTFHSSATGKVYSIDYLYSDATSGYTVDWNNQAQGGTATMALYLSNYSRGREFGAYLPAVTLPELSLAMKSGEYMLPDGTFEAFANSSDDVITFYGED